MQIFIRAVFLHRFDTAGARIAIISDREATMDLLSLCIAGLFFVISIWLLAALERL